jgi:hypothetical protein
VKQAHWHVWTWLVPTPATSSENKYNTTSKKVGVVTLWNVDSTIVLCAAVLVAPTTHPPLRPSNKRSLLNEYHVLANAVSEHKPALLDSLEEFQRFLGTRARSIANQVALCTFTVDFNVTL